MEKWKQRNLHHFLAAWALRFGCAIRSIRWVDKLKNEKITIKKEPKSANLTRILLVIEHLINRIKRDLKSKQWINNKFPIKESDQVFQ